MYIKAFDKNLKCRGFQYEVGKTYTTDKEIELCDNLSNTLKYYQIYSRYCEVIPGKHIKKDECKYVTNSITIVRELTLSELIEKDTTGEWCYYYAYLVPGADRELLQAAVIEKYTTGKWCCYYAKYISGADRELLQAAIIGKDTTGRWCYNYAYFVPGADRELLQAEVIKKDTTGRWCYNYACWIPGADRELLEYVAIEKDKTYNKNKGDKNG